MHQSMMASTVYIQNVCHGSLQPLCPWAVALPGQVTRGLHLHLWPTPMRGQAREAVEASSRRLQPSPSSVTEQATSNRHWVRREDVSAVTQHIIQHLPVKPVQEVRTLALSADMLV